MSKIGAFRVGLGVILGTAAGIGLFCYYYYKQKRKKTWRKDSFRSPNIRSQQNALNPQEHREILQPYNQGMIMMKRLEILPFHIKCKIHLPVFSFVHLSPG